MERYEPLDEWWEGQVAFFHAEAHAMLITMIVVPIATAVISLAIIIATFL